jgi:hypothetical protein
MTPPPDRQGEKREGVWKGEGERTARVKDRGPNPRVDAHIGPCEVEWPHRVRRVYAAAQPVRTEDVHEQVGKRERDCGGLLHTRETPKGPLAIVLLHPHTALRREVGQGVHAGVLAVICARPSCQPQREWLSVQPRPVLGCTGLTGAMS